MKRILYILFYFFCFSFYQVSGQELEPRSLSSAPTGVQFIFLSYSYSEGDVLLDSSIPVEKARASINTLLLGYGKVFNLFGRMARAELILPVNTGTWEGILEGTEESATRTGLADPIVQISMNFQGTPAISRREFSRFREKLNIIASLAMRIPIGQYNSEKLVNLSANRWAFKPKIGFGFWMDRWTIELYASSWLFTDNTNYLSGNRLSQKPLSAIQGHVIHKFPSGFWAAISFGKAFGGETSINNEILNNRQSNTRLGATVAIPMKKLLIRLAFLRGLQTQYGNDFNIFSVGLQYNWLK